MTVAPRFAGAASTTTAPAHDGKSMMQMRAVKAARRVEECALSAPAPISPSGSAFVLRGRPLRRQARQKGGLGRLHQAGQFGEGLGLDAAAPFRVVRQGRFVQSLCSPLIRDPMFATHNQHLSK